MKLTFLIVALFCFNVSASVFAQRITIHEKKAPLQKVLKQLEKQSGYTFIYENSLLQQSKAIAINIKNASLEEALKICFKDQPLTYVIIENTVIIKAKEKNTAQKVTDIIKAAQTIKGKVTDSTGAALPGATLRIKGQVGSFSTLENGEFTILAAEGDQVNISFLGYTPYVFTVEKNMGYQNIVLYELKNTLVEVAVVSTGYQSLPKERATGSFVQLNSELLNRSTGTNILDRIQDVSSGLLFNSSMSQTATIGTVSPITRNSGYVIRGISTLNSSSEPLVVLDNFPYDGEIRNINPNDIESITILKDAAAASIWGARAANGVIVITTKKGSLNRKMEVELNANVTLVNKPDIFYDKNYLGSKEYIEVERYLFNQGYFDTYLSDNFTFPAITPAVDILAKGRANLINSAEMENQLTALAQNDVRRDFNKYVYRMRLTSNTHLVFGAARPTALMHFQLDATTIRTISSGMVMKGRR